MLPTWPALAVFCEQDPTTVQALGNGFVAWAGVLGGGTALGTGLPAAALAFASRVDAHLRADYINRGLGVGFLAGLIIGFAFFVLYATETLT